VSGAGTLHGIKLRSRAGCVAMMMVGDDAGAPPTSPVTSRMSRAREVLRGPWRFVWRRGSGNAVPLRFQPRWRPCFAPTALPLAHCISPRRSGPPSRKPDAGLLTAHRQRRRATPQGTLPTHISNVTPSDPLAAPAIHTVAAKASSFPVLMPGTHTYLVFGTLRDATLAFATSKRQSFAL
jgi:hypothetical protein